VFDWIKRLFAEPKVQPTLPEDPCGRAFGNHCNSGTKAVFMGLDCVADFRRSHDPTLPDVCALTAAEVESLIPYAVCSKCNAFHSGEWFVSFTFRPRTFDPGASEVIAHLENYAKRLWTAFGDYCGKLFQWGGPPKNNWYLNPETGVCFVRFLCTPGGNTHWINAVLKALERANNSCGGEMPTAPSVPAETLPSVVSASDTSLESLIRAYLTGNQLSPEDNELVMPELDWVFNQHAELLEAFLSEEMSPDQIEMVLFIHRTRHD